MNGLLLLYTAYMMKNLKATIAYIVLLPDLHYEAQHMHLLVYRNPGKLHCAPVASKDRKS